MPTGLFKTLFSFIYYFIPENEGARQEKSVAKAAIFWFGLTMRVKNFVGEKKLAALAKQFREASGKSKADAARQLRVSAPSVFNAEERPELSLTGLRIRMIETYSLFKVVGPVFHLKRK
jgi:hypothetical protein